MDGPNAYMPDDLLKSLADISTPTESMPDTVRRLMTFFNRVCYWERQDETGVYQTACGETWEFMNGGVADNNIHHCFGCGGTVKEKTGANPFINEVKPMCNKPCPVCPFRRESLAGYLGNATGDVNAFFDPIWNELHLQPCHSAVDWDAGERPSNTTPLCKGVATMMKNAGKLPKLQRLALLVADTDKDPDVFNFPHEFKEYHNG